MIRRLLVLATPPTILVLALVGAADILGVLLVSKAVPGAIEISRVLFAVVVFGGMAEAYATRANISIDIFAGKLSASGTRLLDVLAHALSAALFALLSAAFCLNTVHSIQIRERADGLLGLPVYPFKVLICISLLAVLIAAIRSLRTSLWPRGPGAHLTSSTQTRNDTR